MLQNLIEKVFTATIESSDNRLLDALFNKANFVQEFLVKNFQFDGFSENRAVATIKEGQSGYVIKILRLLEKKKNDLPNYLDQEFTNIIESDSYKNSKAIEEKPIC